MPSAAHLSSRGYVLLLDNFWKETPCTAADFFFPRRVGFVTVSEIVDGKGSESNSMLEPSQLFHANLPEENKNVFEGIVLTEMVCRGKHILRIRFSRLCYFYLGDRRDVSTLDARRITLISCCLQLGS